MTYNKTWSEKVCTKYKALLPTPLQRDSSILKNLLDKRLELKLYLRFLIYIYFIFSINPKIFSITFFLGLSHDLINGSIVVKNQYSEEILEQDFSNIIHIRNRASATRNIKFSTSLILNLKSGVGGTDYVVTCVAMKAVGYASMARIFLRVDVTMRNR